MWVTHQNLARSKGGRPAYQQPPKKKKAPAAEAPKKEDATPETTDHVIRDLGSRDPPEDDVTKE